MSEPICTLDAIESESYKTLITDYDAFITTIENEEKVEAAAIGGYRRRRPQHGGTPPPPDFF